MGRPRKITPAALEVDDPPEEKDSDLDLQPEQIQAMEEEGLGPRQIIREVKALLAADPSKVIEIKDGKPSLKPKAIPKHYKAIVEISATKIRFVDRIAALRLAAEMGKLIGKKEAPKPLEQPITFKRAIVVMAAPDEMAKAQLPPTVPGEVIEVEAEEVDEE